MKYWKRNRAKGAYEIYTDFVVIGKDCPKDVPLYLLICKNRKEGISGCNLS